MAESTERTETCRNCKWWVAPKIECLRGTCRVGGPAHKISQWPETRYDDWCGRHKPVPPEPPPSK